MENPTNTFIVVEVANKENFVRTFVYPYAILTQNAKNAKEFPTYSKANTYAKKLNKFYGYKRFKPFTLAKAL